MLWRIAHSGRSSGRSFIARAARRLEDTPPKVDR